MRTWLLTSKYCKHRSDSEALQRSGGKMLAGMQLAVCVILSCLSGSQAAAESSIDLKPALNPAQDQRLTLSGCVRLARTNYPKILQEQAEMRAAKRNVTLQKVKEYNPDLLMSYQSVTATHNRLTQTLFSSPVLPATPGPGPESVHMSPKAFSAAGFIIDWAPLDFGLHKARINVARADLKLSQASLALTVLDVTVAAAERFLQTLIMREQVTVAEANVQRFLDFSKVVHAQVDAGLKSQADASLADSQLADARNDLIRARLNHDLARADLGLIVGQGGQSITIEPGAMVRLTEPGRTDRMQPVFAEHPLIVARKALVSTTIAKRLVLDKEYYPVLRFLGGFNLRGTTFRTNRGDVEAPDVSGIFPVIPNWNVGLMIDLPLLDIIRIRAQKKVVDEQITSAQQSYNLALQELRTQDLQARARVDAAIALAENMPVQVRAAAAAALQAQARYEAGLATVADVATANELLAESRVKEAVANVGVWKALLDAASVRGDLVPFLAAADRATSGETP